MSSPGRERLLHYELLSKIGEGGMGVVYKARDTHLDRIVAVKLLPRDQFGDPGRYLRFQREAKTAGSLNHPNIVTVYDVAAIEGQAFIAMEYVEGRTLGELIGRKGLSTGSVLDLGIQIADAFARAHAHGIVHRDLKPANVMVDAHGCVKVLDFGLAKLFDRTFLESEDETATLQATQEGQIVGTLSYMSPEQAEGKAVDARSDIFSFGCVLYEMVTGRHAFDGGSTASVLAAILNAEPKRPREMVPGIPASLERVILRCLRKNLGERFQHMDDLAVELRAIREEQKLGISSALDGAHSAPVTLLRRWGWAAGVLGLILVATEVAYQYRNRLRPAEQKAISFQRLTWDNVLATQPTISQDGKLVAYASDRGGDNLDIWVQQVAGGEPIRLSPDAANDSEPSFSPDGSQIAFRSERQEPGIYLVPALGGEARLLARDGRRPRFSPDGSQVAYWVGGVGMQRAGVFQVLVVPTAGGTPRQVQGGLSRAYSPIWCPGGQHLLVHGSKTMQDGYDWWVVPLDGSAALKTDADRYLRTRIRSSITPDTWFGEHVLFSAPSGDAVALWKIAIRPKEWKAVGPPQAVAAGTGQMGEVAVSQSGDAVVSSLGSTMNLWALPLETNRGQATGEIQRITDGAAMKFNVALSPDGTKAAYNEGRYPEGVLKIRDLLSGKENVLVSGALAPFYPSFTPDSRRVLYRVGAFQEARRPELFLSAAGGGMPEKICDGCGNAAMFSPDGTLLAYDWEQPRRIELFDVTTKKPGVYAQHPEWSLLQPQFCPNGNWILFVAVTGDGRSRVMVAPFQGLRAAEKNTWIPLTDGKSFDIRARWSPDGQTVYFVSDRDGFRCVWAQKLDGMSKQPIGLPFVVLHMHNPRRATANIPELMMGVARDKIVLNVAEQSGAIWLTKLQ